jgi:tetratricopeptide (TPR) repeat protein
MHNRQLSGGTSGRPPLFLLLLLVLGVSTLKGQVDSGPTLVKKGIAQYESALFEDAISTLEQARNYELDHRDSIQAFFYLGFCHYKLGQPDQGDRFLRMIARRDPDAKLPEGAEEFADALERAKRQAKEGPETPIEQPPPHAAETTAAAQPHPQHESVYVRRPVYVQPGFANYLAGAAAGAALGLASYFTSVLCDNMAADKVKAYSVAGDSVEAGRLKGQAREYHSLGSVCSYSSYPLIAVGFYLGLKLSEKAIPGKVSLLEETSPTRVCCSLDKDLNLSLGVRRSIW